MPGIAIRLAADAARVVQHEAELAVAHPALLAEEAERQSWTPCTEGHRTPSPWRSSSVVGVVAVVAAAVVVVVVAVAVLTGREPVVAAAVEVAGEPPALPQAASAPRRARRAP